jgi:hypothetical protein
MEIRPVTRADRKEWARMRVALYTDPPVRENAAGVIRRCGIE